MTENYPLNKHETRFILMWQ